MTAVDGGDGPQAGSPIKKSNKLTKKKTIDKRPSMKSVEIEKPVVKAPSPADDPDFSIDLSDDYEDDDYDLPFANRKELLEYLKRLEDDNLFKINLMQDEEESLKQ